MTMQSIETIMDRISVATWDSPIIVYGPMEWRKREKSKRYPNPIKVRMLDARFASTKISHRTIRDGNTNIVGVFTKHFNKKWVRARLLNAPPAFKIR